MRISQFFQSKCFENSSKIVVSYKVRKQKRRQKNCFHFFFLVKEWENELIFVLLFSFSFSFLFSKAYSPGTNFQKHIQSQYDTFLTQTNLSRNTNKHKFKRYLKIILKIYSFSCTKQNQFIKYSQTDSKHLNHHVWCG